MCDPVSMTVLAVTAAVVTAGGQIYQGQAANAQGKYQQAVANQNATLEERARADAITRGETAQSQHYRKLAQAMGEARVRNSAAGLDVGFGSAANLESDIALIGYEDSSTLAQNTIKEVQGYDINAANYRNQGAAARAQGKAAATAGFIGAAGTLLSSASQIGGGNMAKGNSFYGGSPRAAPAPTFTGPRI